MKKLLAALSVLSVLFFFSPFQVQASGIAFDAASIYNSTNWGSGTSITWSHTVTGSNTFLAVCVFEGSGTDKVTGVTYNSVAMTQVTKQIDELGLNYILLYELENPATGAHNIVVSASGSIGAFNGSAASYTGVAQTGQPEAHASNNTHSSGNQTVAVTTLTDQAWLIGCDRANAGEVAAGTNTKLRDGYAGGGFYYMDSNAAQAPAGSHSLNTTSGGTNGFMTIGASIAPVAAAPSSFGDLIFFQ